MARPLSGRFVLRVPPAVHQALRRRAHEQGVSLNQFCIERLTAMRSTYAANTDAVLSLAVDAFGDALAGVVLYGSWPRGESTPDSDVDILVVVAAAVPLTRDLYQRFDRGDLSWAGRPVQFHIVHLPADGSIAGGLWPEIALDGIVLFERDYDVSRRLVTIRRAIADGRLVRRTAHGQPYWTGREAA